MPYNEKIREVQQALMEKKIDGWLLYDFRRSNELACRFLEIPLEQLLSRRFFYWIPAKGQPIQLVSAVEPHVLHKLPGKPLVYSNRHQMEEHLSAILHGTHKITMEYSHRAEIPAVSRVDAGTMELIRSFGVDVISSGDILQQYTAVLSREQMKTHHAATIILDRIVTDSWKLILSYLTNGKTITEYDVQQYILESFEKNHCITDHPPICAVNEHTADPHYSVEKKSASPILSGDFVLIDLWCKQNIPYSVYGDITRVGVIGTAPTPKQQEIFDIVYLAQDTTAAFIQQEFKKGIPIRGCDVDIICRDIIAKAGYGDYFIHRTGHNIGEDLHGPGANLDSWDTYDTRTLLPGTCCSLEPGIYLPGEFGVRLEYDLSIDHDGNVHITGRDSHPTLQK